VSLCRGLNSPYSIKVAKKHSVILWRHKPSTIRHNITLNKKIESLWIVEQEKDILSWVNIEIVKLEENEMKEIARSKCGPSAMSTSQKDLQVLQGTTKKEVSRIEGNCV